MIDVYVLIGSHSCSVVVLFVIMPLWVEPLRHIRLSRVNNHTESIERHMAS